jgi:2-keto-3-deoxy-L-rhamnonate aldolase RhmA
MEAPNSMPYITNPAKQRLKAGNPVLVFNVFESLRPSVVKVVRNAGYHMLMIETEHVLHDEYALTDFVVSARDNGLSPLVTVPTTDRIPVSRLLDAGALGMNLCHAETPEQVADMVRWMKYPPAGERALAMGANVEYKGVADAERYCREANEATLLMLKIESRRGIENAEALLSNEWVDAVVFGPGDLAASMGLHGQWRHPAVLEAMETVISLALARGIAVEPSEPPGSVEAYRALRLRGVQIFGPTRRTEYEMLREAAERAIAHCVEQE